MSRYVKLISSDGHEFIVKRDNALTSGTIKAMLSGPGQFAENETNEVRIKFSFFFGYPVGRIQSKKRTDIQTSATLMHLLSTIRKSF